MTKRVYIHIGEHKTGTTSLQGFLLENIEFLAQNGCHYLIFPEYTHMHPYGGAAAHPIAWALEFGYKKGNAKFKGEKYKIEIQKKIESALNSPDVNNMIVSSEIFSTNRSHERICALKDLFIQSNSNIEFQIILYLRRQDLFLESFFKEYVKNNDFKKLNDISGVLKLVDADYSHLIDDFESVFGKQSINIRILENQKMISGSLYHDFLSIIGLSLSSGFKAPERTNISLSNDLVYALSKYNKIRKKSNDRITQHIEPLNAFFKTKTRTVFWSDKERKKILEKFEKSNRAIAQKYLSVDSLFDESDLLENKDHYSDPDEIIVKLMEYIAGHANTNKQGERIKNIIKYKLVNLFSRWSK